MAQADQLDLLKLFLESNGVEDPGRVCQQMHEHGVTTLTKFAELSVEKLVARVGHRRKQCVLLGIPWGSITTVVARFA